MSRRLAVLPLLSLFPSWLVACGDPGVDPDDPGDVQFEPLCGQEGPVELLALAADEEVVAVKRIDDGDDFHLIVKDDEDVLPDEPGEVRRSAVIDECGSVIAEIPSDVHYLTWWDDALIGCIGDDLVWLTGYDDPSPSILARRGCGARRVGEHWVALDAEQDATVGRLVSIDTDGSAVTVRELVDEIVISDSTVYPSVMDGELLAQTTDLAVHRVDPSTGALELLLEQAAERRWSLNGNMIAYRLPSTDPDDPGPLILRDRRTGTEQTVDPGFTVLSFGWSGDGLLGTTGGIDDVQWYRVDPLRALALPAGTSILLHRDDGLLWLERSDPDLGVYELLLWREGEAPQSALACSSCRPILHSRSTTYVEVLLQTADPERRELWRLEDAGGPPRLLGNAAHAGTPLDDGRVLSVLLSEGLEHGPLVLSDDMGEDQVTIASDVDMSSIDLTVGFDAPGEIVYEERHPDGTSSLLRARLAP